MSEGHAEEAAAPVRERLREIEAAGGRTFAGPAYAFAETLLTRGEAIGGEAGARLIARAAARAEALAHELEEAKTRARGELAEGEDPAGALSRAVESGDLGVVLRAARRRRLAPVRSSAGDAQWLARLAADARARGLSLTGHARTPGALSAALYASSRDEVAAMGVALRAQAEVPVNAGPYNPLAIAARALAELSAIAPAYLAALVGHLDELAPLLTLPPPPPEGARTSNAPARKRATKRPSGR